MVFCGVICLRIPFFLLLALAVHCPCVAQATFNVAQYTSKQGLPQNSIRALAFDQYGFLWVATEGGAARFDGRRVRVYNKEDHPGINNQRFSHALACNDSTIALVDFLSGIYTVTNNRISTLQEPSAQYKSMLAINGAPGDPRLLTQNPLIKKEILGGWPYNCTEAAILPTTKNRLFVVANHVKLLDLTDGTHRVLRDGGFCGEHVASLQGYLLWLDQAGHLTRLHPDAAASEPCTLIDQTGHPWTKPFKKARLYSQYPFKQVFINDGKSIYMLEPATDRAGYMVRVMVDEIPDRCILKSIAYRSADGVLVLGTDTRGMFVYTPQYFHTAYYTIKFNQYYNSYYAQWLMDHNSLLISNRQIVDPENHLVKGTFPYTFSATVLCADAQNRLYFCAAEEIHWCDSKNPNRSFGLLRNQTGVQFMANMDGVVWLGTYEGVGYIRADSIQWVHRMPDRGERFAVKCLAFDGKGDLWFGNHFQVYRLDTATQRLDSFPQLENTDSRVITRIGDKLFIGTYGSGYFVYYQGRLVRMPAGRNNELAHTHAFVTDEHGYLWLPTNKGLFKTHLDAVDAYLKDSTEALYYYAYLEEDGIQSTEFNGGCSPTHVWLPGGRLSLPTMEGLVDFHPRHTPHVLTKDTVTLESIDIDGVRHAPGATLTVPYNHISINIRFASAWWGQPLNQEVWYKLEGLHARFQLCEIGQTSYSIGHIKPGKYALVLRRRCGFGPSDFVYSRQYIEVQTPWYAHRWALALYSIGLLFGFWGLASLYTYSVRQRNNMLQQKVDEQTAAIRRVNTSLEENFHRLELSEQNLRRNMRVRDRLISIITHDILTPLRFIGLIARMGAEAPAQEEDEEGLTKKALSDVQHAVGKLFLSTQNMLNWVNVQQEAFKPKHSNCSPFVITEQLMEDFSEIARFQGNTMFNAVGEDDVIYTDPQILTIILHNLLSNALKFTKKGVIKVGSGNGHEGYYLEVEDTGRGMTQAQLHALRQGAIDQQHTASNDDASAGNGIGLSLVYALLQALGGRWEIYSTEGAGVQVRIYLYSKKDIPL